MQFLKDFGVEPLLFVAQIVNFLILLLILRKLLYKPVLRILEERREKISESLRKAAEIDEQFQEAQEKRREIIKEASDQADLLIAQSKIEAEKIHRDAINLARKDAEEFIIKIKATLSVERDQMKRELQKNFMELMAATLSKIMGKSLTIESQKKIQAQALKELKQ